MQIEEYEDLVKQADGRSAARLALWATHYRLMPYGGAIIQLHEKDDESAIVSNGYAALEFSSIAAARRALKTAGCTGNTRTGYKA